MILRRGDSGKYVVLLQEALGLPADGQFGPKTEAAVKVFQKAKGLAADGVVGPATQYALQHLNGPVVIPPVINPDEPGIPVVGDSSAYRLLFDSMSIRSGWVNQANSAADLVLTGKARYEALSEKVNIPWYLIGSIHLMEGDCNFKTHLHNGDSLARRTVHVPAGRPKSGTPPFSWEESAIDALNYDNIKPPQDTIGEQFSALEHFNGMGYRTHGINTPYLWSGSNHYSAGKYVADGVWSASAVSEQVGAACIYKIFKDRGIIIL